MSTKPRKYRDDELRRILAERDIRVTDQRMTVLRELAQLTAPISHSELTERLTSRELDRATIYRNLLFLAEAGILVRIQLGDSVWRYELPHTRNKEHGAHPHFVCTDCGDVACLPKDTVVLRGDAASGSVHEIQLRGVCRHCDGKSG